jgi:hypothetical protein
MCGPSLWFFLIPAGEVYYTRTRTNRGDVLSWLLTRLFELYCSDSGKKTLPFKIIVVINYFKLVDNPHNTAGFLNVLYLRKLTC